MFSRFQPSSITLHTLLYHSLASESSLILVFRENGFWILSITLQNLSPFCLGQNGIFCLPGDNSAVTVQFFSHKGKSYKANIR